MPAEPPDFALFEHAQQLGLRADGHFADFIQQQRTPAGQFEITGAALRCARERALFVTEQLAFDQCLRQGCAIHGEKRAGAPGAQIVDGARSDFLAGAGFAADQNRRFCRRGLLQLRKNETHRRGMSDQTAQYAARGQLPFEAL